MSALALSDVREIEGEPRVLDLLIGERLGFGRPRDVRKIIQPRLGELARYGEVSRRIVAKPLAGSKGWRPQYGYHLNEAQALLVCMFSETPAAADVREQLIRVFMAYQRIFMAGASN
ncbi:MAG: hypothetical protein ACOY45_15545 [Pseudomonadota bacterium]